MTFSSERATYEAFSALMCIPVYGVKDWHVCNDFDFLGTGTLIRFGARFIMLTAAHVIDKVDAIAIAGFSPPLVLKRPAGITANRVGQLDVDAIDLANVDAHFRGSRFSFVEWSKIDVNWDREIRSPFCRIIGYPSFKNAARQDAQMLTACFIDVSVLEDEKVVIHSPKREIATHRDWYIGLRYDPRMLKKKFIKRPKIKAFNGFSGGSVWQYGMNGVWNLAGVVIECHSPNPTKTGGTELGTYRDIETNRFASDRARAAEGCASLNGSREDVRVGAIAFSTGI